MIKRTIDFGVALAGLIVLFPFFLIVAALIKFDSPGPVFYRQERVGLQGKLFKVFKFRSMKIDSDKSILITIGQRDPRITTMGYFLRKLKIDELPQLINVLKGEMSLVGPRPEVEKFVKLYNPDQVRVLSVKPGITDYASIKFRNENKLLEGKPDPIEFYVNEIMPEKLRLNLKYIDSQSLLTDIRIISKTLFLLIARK
jgi:lipopolysaccharide/colanic/teichoic acid biosynthesis glycosyltransferase